jgi:hypothetical protein
MGPPAPSKEKDKNKHAGTRERKRRRLNDHEDKFPSPSPGHRSHSQATHLLPSTAPIPTAIAASTLVPSSIVVSPRSTSAPSTLVASTELSAALPIPWTTSTPSSDRAVVFPSPNVPRREGSELYACLNFLVLCRLISEPRLPGSSHSGFRPVQRRHSRHLPVREPCSSDTEEDTQGAFCPADVPFIHCPLSSILILYLSQRLSLCLST